MSTRTDIAIDDEDDGVIMITQHPNQWPNNGRFVSTRSQIAVAITPTLFYTTDDVLKLLPEQRQCLQVRDLLILKELKTI